MKGHSYYVGIDAGQKTGLAVWDTKAHGFLEIRTTDFWEALDLLGSMAEELGLDAINVVVEDPGQIRPTFPREASKNPRIRDRISQSVGSVKRETELLIDGLSRKGFHVKRSRPGKGKSKISAKEFKRLTGVYQRTSQHARDAAWMVYGY